MMRDTAKSIAEFCYLLAFAGAVIVVIHGVVSESTTVPPTRPILAPIASLATTYCPDRLEVFELRLAQEACFETWLLLCDAWHPSNERQFEACLGRAESCSFGNTQGGWTP